MYTDFFIKDAFPQWKGDTENVCKIFLLIDKLFIIKIVIIFEKFNKKNLLFKILITIVCFFCINC